MNNLIIYDNIINYKNSNILILKNIIKNKILIKVIKNKNKIFYDYIKQNFKHIKYYKILYGKKLKNLIKNFEYTFNSKYIKNKSLIITDNITEIIDYNKINLYPDVLFLKNEYYTENEFNTYINNIIFKNNIIGILYNFNQLSDFIYNINKYKYTSIIINLNTWITVYIGTITNIIILPKLIISILLSLKMLNNNGKLIFTYILDDNTTIFKLIILLNEYFSNIKYKINKYNINYIKTITIICKNRNNKEYKENINEIIFNNIDNTFEIINNIIKNNTINKNINYIKDININLNKKIKLIKLITYEYQKNILKINKMNKLYNSNQKLYKKKFKNNLIKTIKWYIIYLKQNNYYIDKYMINQLYNINLKGIDNLLIYKEPIKFPLILYKNINYDEIIKIWNNNKDSINLSIFNTIIKKMSILKQFRTDLKKY